MVGEHGDSGELPGRLADGSAGQLLCTIAAGKEKRYQSGGHRTRRLQESFISESREWPYLGIGRSHHLGLPAANIANPYSLARRYVRKGYLDHPHAPPPSGRREIHEPAARGLRALSIQRHQHGPISRTRCALRAAESGRRRSERVLRKLGLWHRYSNGE